MIIRKNWSKQSKKTSLNGYELIDYDVILDLFFDREPFTDYVNEVFTLCENNKIKGFTTPVIISNVYYLLTKITKHEIVIEKLKQLLRIIDIAEIDNEVIIEALNSKFTILILAIIVPTT